MERHFNKQTRGISKTHSFPQQRTDIYPSVGESTFFKHMPSLVEFFIVNAFEVYWELADIGD